MIDTLIVGAGPAGLFAADHLSARGHSVLIADRMGSPARKLLMAGRGGLNITHSEPIDAFVGRYRDASAFLSDPIATFSPGDLRHWCDTLGAKTFIGSSGRVFPKAMKASPLLRALLARLAEQQVTLRTGLTFTGLTVSGARFIDQAGEPIKIAARSVLLALGGASWPRLGSNGGWVPAIEGLGVKIRPFRPANCGFVVRWSEYLVPRFAGSPLKRVTLALDHRQVLGEALISERGLEGGAVYALSAEIRDRIDQAGPVAVTLDLRPDLTAEALADRLTRPRGKQSISSFLRKAVRLTPVEAVLLREAGPLPTTPPKLAARIKAVPVRLEQPYDIDRAISSAGGIALDEVSDTMMLTQKPGVFVAGEMLDWEAPTGGYLLQACFSTAFAAARGIETWLDTEGTTEALP